MKKTFAVLMLATMVFAVGCGNEASTNNKNLSTVSKTATANANTQNLSLESQKIQEGLDLFDLGDYNGAINFLDEISALNLVTVDEYNLRGEYFLKVGRYHFDIMQNEKGKELLDLAIQDYDSAIQIDPDDVDSHINRGNAYCKQGEYDTAIPDYDKAIELAPNNVDAYIARGEAYDLSLQDKKDLAIQDLNKAIQLNPNYFKAYIARSNFYLSSQQYDLALENANKAVELNSEAPEVYNQRGCVYLNLKQYDSAIKDHNKALELDPKNFSAYIDLGHVYFALKQYEQAIEELNKGIEIYPLLNAVNLRRHCDYLIHKRDAENK